MTLRTLLGTDHQRNLTPTIPVVVQQSLGLETVAEEHGTILSLASQKAAQSVRDRQQDELVDLGPRHDVGGPSQLDRYFLTLRWLEPDIKSDYYLQQV